jgi:hypothetical protein
VRAHLDFWGRGVARTKGAKNKRTVGIPAELRDALGHRDPAEVLAEVYSMPQVALQKMMRSAAGARAVAIRVQAAVAAMPYQHSKMPVAVTMQQDSLPVLVIDRVNHQMQQNQQLSSDDMASVSREASHAEYQVIESKGESHE